MVAPVMGFVRGDGLDVIACLPVVAVTRGWSVATVKRSSTICSATVAEQSELIGVR
jgi:hypothetical protein